MKLVIFDIDGTLTDTNGIDDDCYLRAFEDALGVTDIGTDWENYPHTTDSAIARHIFQTKFDRAPRAEELEKHKAAFLELLRRRSLANPDLFEEIAGAGAMLERLRRENGWAISIATGSRADAVRLKMDVAKIGHYDLPLASADDALSREEILRVAIERALEFYNQPAFEKIVSVGDGIWDVRTAANLGLRFLGVGNERAAQALRRAGAKITIENFSGYDLFLTSLEKAEIPARTARPASPPDYPG